MPGRHDRRYGDHHVSRVSRGNDGDDADRSLPILPRVPGVRRCHAAEAGGLLCLLLVRRSAMPVRSTVGSKGRELRMNPVDFRIGRRTSQALPGAMWETRGTMPWLSPQSGPS